MKQVILFFLCMVAFLGWWHFHNPTSEQPSEQAQSTLTLWDIGFVPCIPAKEYTTPLVVSHSTNGETLENVFPPPKKPFLVHFWAPWCAPCRAELPCFAQFAASHSDVSMWCVADSDQTPQNVKSFYEGQKLSGLPIMIDSHNKLAQRIHVNSLPTTVFFDAQGRERGRIVGGIDWTHKDVAALIMRELLS